MAKKQTTSYKSLGFWEKLGMTFTRPSELFSAVSGQKGYGSLLKYYSVFVGLFLLFYWVYFNLSPQIRESYGLTSFGLVWGISNYFITDSIFIFTSFSHIKLFIV